MTVHDDLQSDYQAAMAMVPDENVKVPPYERCHSCNGSGLALNCYSGEPEDCRECRGDGWVRARDERGRFIGNSMEHRP
jgi:DnaJ-class molecular chaperone